MMRRIGVLGILALGLALPAAAHVGIAPRESKPGAQETYTLRVPTEGQVATTSVYLQVPDGMTVTDVPQAEGATHEIKKEGARTTWAPN